MTARKILIFSEAVTLAHVARPYLIAKELCQLGFEVHFASANRFNFIFDEPSITHHWIDSKDHKTFINIVTSGKTLYSARELIAYAYQDIELIKAVKPHLVMGDFRHSLAISTRLTNTLFINLINSYWSPYSPNKKILPIPELRQINLAKLPFIKHAMPILSKIIFSLQGRALNKARHYFSLPKFEHCLDGWTFGDITAYYDVPDFIPLSNLPEHHHFIGPVLWEPNLPLPKWWHPFNKQSFIYVAMGSSAGEGHLEMVVERLMAQGRRILVSGISESEKPSSWSKLVVCAAMLPGSQVAGQAALVITNGGSPSSYQALRAGTPVIGIPANMDQLLGMTNIQRLKGGYLVRPREINTAVFDDLVQNILDGVLDEQVMSLAKTLEGIDFKINIASLVNSILPPPLNQKQESKVQQVLSDIASE